MHLGRVKLIKLPVDKSGMTQFDQEMRLFEEIKSKYKPIEGYHLVLDLVAYRNGKEILFKFKLGSEVYRILVNTKYACGNLDCVIITFSNRKIVSLNSKYAYLRYDLDKTDLLEFEDRTVNHHNIKRTLRQQAELLVYELNNPKPQKPIC